MLNANQQKEFIPFVMAGHPTLKASQELIYMFISLGCRTIELGVPFSDPLADGVAIQAAASCGLENGVHLKEIFIMVSEIKSQFTDVSLVLFTYLNPLLKYGLREAVQDAASAGLDATLTVDLPVEEAQDYLELHERSNLKTVFLASPTTSPARFKKIAVASTGFVYYISRLGVTGAREDISTSLASEYAMLKKLTHKPIAVGFGIATPEQARQVSRFADAVVVGSKIITLINSEANFRVGLENVRLFTNNCLTLMNAQD
jgi:tryptophan synthase alpha chain